MRYENGILNIRLPAFWTSKQLAEFLQISPKTVIGYRKRKVGPRYTKFKSGAIRYNTKDVRDWLDEGINIVAA